MNYSNHGHLLSCETIQLIDDESILVISSMLEDYGDAYVTRSELITLANMMLMGAEMA